MHQNIKKDTKNIYIKENMYNIYYILVYIKKSRSFDRCVLNILPAPCIYWIGILHIEN